MAKLKIYNLIEDEDSKTILEGWFGIKSVCFNDVKTFIEQIPEDDGDIDVHLHCPGGSCVEGFAIYDALRTSGKRITTVVDGMCASMATVIMMAAPKERRFAQKNASFCIHNPYIPDYFNWEEGATADDLDNLAKKVQIQADDLRATQNKILDVYVERTGSNREELQALMDEDRWIESDRALELGLIGSTLEPNTDNKNPKSMNKVSVEASVFAKMLAKLGIKSADELKDMVVTAANGDEITVDRNSGEPQVGDKASPDGSYVMEDGSVLTVLNGVISSIEDPVDAKDKVITDLKAEITALNAKIADLDAAKAELEGKVKTEDEINALAKVSDLEAQVTDLNAKVTDLTTSLEAAKADAKSDSDKAILSKIADITKDGMDAMQWLDLAAKASSTFTSDKGAFKENHGNGEDEAPLGTAYLEEKRAKRKKGIAI